MGRRTAQNQGNQPLSVQDMAVYLERQSSFEQIGAFGVTPLNVSMEEERPERLRGGQLTVAAFRAIGMQPVIGRGFREGDDQPGAAPVILLSDSVWRERYRGSVEAIGRSMRVNGTLRTIIGIMPPEFGFPFHEAAWIPLEIDPLVPRAADAPAFGLVGRLKRGVSVEQAQAQAASIASQLEAQFPQTNKGVGAVVLPFTEMAMGPQIYALLYTMLGAGIGVLLIACVNVSNLLAARAALRHREVAVRIALGAGRLRVVRQHLTEVLVLAALGGGVGVLFSIGAMRWFTTAV
jgi:putative ABC transport system permease protein